MTATSTVDMLQGRARSRAFTPQPVGRLASPPPDEPAVGTGRMPSPHGTSRPGAKASTHTHRRRGKRVGAETQSEMFRWPSKLILASLLTAASVSPIALGCSPCANSNGLAFRDGGDGSRYTRGMVSRRRRAQLRTRSRRAAVVEMVHRWARRFRQGRCLLLAGSAPADADPPAGIETSAPTLDRRFVSGA